MDLYGTNGNAIAMGNARRQQVRELNERIQQHNTDIANAISEQFDQKKTTEKIRDAQQAAQAMWSGAHMPDKIKKYNEWRAKRAAGDGKANPIANEASEQADRVAEAGPPAEVETPPPEAPSAEEISTRTGAATSEATEGLEDIAGRSSTAVADIGEAAAAEGLKSGAGSALKEGAIKSFGKVAGAAGGLMAAAQGGLDIYDDVKAGGIAGNNNWEKAGNILQIGGSIADIAGAAFPPAALLGGVLDLASAATTEIGEAEEEGKESGEEKGDIQAEQQQQIAAPVQQTVATGRVQ
jgi:hypothetical protein